MKWSALARTKQQGAQDKKDTGSVLRPVKDLSDTDFYGEKNKFRRMFCICPPVRLTRWGQNPIQPNDTRWHSEARFCSSLK